MSPSPVPDTCPGNGATQSQSLVPGAEPRRDTESSPTALGAPRRPPPPPCPSALCLYFMTINLFKWLRTHRVFIMASSGLPLPIKRFVFDNDKPCFLPKIN